MTRYAAPTIGTLFTGFGGCDVGAQAAGLTSVWGVELDPAIAAVAQSNLGHRVVVANILDTDPSEFEWVDALHASPPCPNFSVANANGGETELDIALARKVAEFVTVLQPRIVTLENVWAYRHSRSWAIVEDALHGAGYWVHVDHVNAADHGVPQTRKRMIVRAIKGGFVPYMPEPVPWVGWYAAIEDLLPALPESQFAPWQLARLPELLQTCLIDSKNAGQEWGKLYRAVAEPAITVVTDDRPSHMPRAFIMQVQGEGGDGVRYDIELMQTVASNHGAAKYRAYLVNESSTMEARAAHGSCAAQVASPRNLSQRALLSQGRVVAMTPRALARFQSFPDTYQLPSNARLAARGIGNACPPLLMQRIYEQLLEATS